MLVPHFQEAARHLLQGVEGKPRVNLSRAFQDTALEAVLRALFSMPDHQAREQLSSLVRSYVEGAGRPGLFDGFATSEESFGFVLGKRKRFQAKWFAAIAGIIARRKAEPKLAGHHDLLDLLVELKDAETGEILSDNEIRDQSATMIFAGSETTARLMFWQRTCWRSTRTSNGGFMTRLRPFHPIVSKRLMISRTGRGYAMSC